MIPVKTATQVVASDHVTGRTSQLAQRAHRFRWATVLCLSLCIGVGLATGKVEEGPLVIGWFVPRMWHLTVFLLVGGVACALIGVGARIANDDFRAQPIPVRWYVRALVNVGKLTLLVAAFLATLWSLLFGVIWTAHVLQPASAGGCRVVVMSSEMLTWDVRVYLLPRGAIRGQFAGQYPLGPDSLAPGDVDLFRLRWKAETPELTARNGGSSWQHVPIPPCGDTRG